MPAQRRAADDSPRDVLAAEFFAVPAPDPGLHSAPVVLPPDPTGIEEPHDVLAAEEFPMPAPGSGGLSGRRAEGKRARLALAAGAAGVLLAIWRSRRL